MKGKGFTWLIVVFLSVLAAILVFKNRWSTTGNNFEALLPDDNAHFNRITLVHMSDTLSFSKESEEWKFGDEILQSQAINNLIVASKELSVTSIVPFGEIGAFDYVLEISYAEGKKELNHFIFARSDSTYYVFGSGAKEAYAVELLGAGNIPLEKFFSNELNHYRIHVLINLLPSEIKEVEIDPLKGKSFRLVQDADKQISVFEDISGEEITELVLERRMRMFLSYFNTIRYNEVVNEPVQIIRTNPDARIYVEDNYGNTYNLEVFQWIHPENQDSDIYEALLIFNDYPEVLRVDYYYLDLLLRGLDYYLEPN
ncbi:hypothetical protein ACFLT1_00310 [Bacteroidota bacterium]